MTRKKRIYITGSGEIRTIIRGKRYRIRHRIPKEANGGEYGWSPMRTVYGTIADARVALEEYRLELEAEINGDLVNQAFAEYADAFHQHRVEAGVVAQSTLDRERAQIKQICGILGKKDIGEITLADVNAAYDRLRREGVTQTGINSFHRKLNQIMTKALKEEVIPRNPCLLVEASEVR